MYDATVFDKIKTLVPSGRGELEITDVNNAYIREGTMTFSYLDGWWTDAGTFESLLRAANLVAQSAAQEVPAAVEVAVASLMAPSTPLANRTPARSRPPAISTWPYPECAKGPRLRHRLARFAGSHRRRARAAVSRLSRTTAAIFSKCSASAAAWSPAFRPETTQISAALNYPGTIKAFHFHLHQTDCWTPAKGMLQVALADLRRGSPTFGMRNTMYVGALRPWQC